MAAHLHQAYQEKAQALQGRLGPQQLDLSKPLAAQIRGLAEVRFGSESAAVYHVHKHFHELPPSHQAGPGTEMVKYLHSLERTVKASTGDTPKIGQDGSRIFEFRKTYSEGGTEYEAQAIVRVGKDGKAVVLTYFVPKTTTIASKP